ncbi:unnamed protein product [Durusdinium trenchii]|uniref:Uncharacterized protein n=1 Tax=Durusdinium trenchii TaxID=1381693 RepID=A0ABP0IXI1_9DINO
MSMHPLSDKRSGCARNNVSMKEVWARRKLGNFVLQNSTSESYQSHCEAAGPQAVESRLSHHARSHQRAWRWRPVSRPTLPEFSSNDTIHRVRQKHTRSKLAPCDKYKWMKVASTNIGWHAETDHGKSLLRPPVHGITESTVTKTYSNMKATNMEACLRLCK